MWQVNELIVISDLHLEAERDTGSFQSDRELADCLRWILTETKDSVIVIAGDMLDLQSARNCQTNSDRSSCYVKQIIKHHPEVFDALENLAQSSRHHLVIMGGDHDSELLFPNVQETLESRLGVGLTKPAIRWLVREEALRLQVGNAVVVVDHGNMLDPWNRIDHGNLQESLALNSRNLTVDSDYVPPLGSRLTSRVINDLRAHYSWIPSLKPANELILPLLWRVGSARHQGKIRELAEDYLSLRTFALNKKPSNSSEIALLYGERETEQLPKDQAFEEWTDAIYSAQQQKPTNGDLQGELLEKTRLISGQDGFFDVEQPDSHVKYLEPVFKSGADLVIQGHTHAAKALKFEHGVYLNTGTWAQVLSVPQSSDSDGAWIEFFDQLRANDLKSFSRPTFAYVRGSVREATTIATLFEWRQSNPTVLARYECGK